MLGCSYLLFFFIKVEFNDRKHITGIIVPVKIHFVPVLHQKEQKVRHDLAIEKGRYANVVRKDRICPLCKNGVEDEMHFLFFCNFFCGFAIPKGE